MKEQWLRINDRHQNTYPGILEHQKSNQKSIYVYIHTVENVGPERGQGENIHLDNRGARIKIILDFFSETMLTSEWNILGDFEGRNSLEFFIQWKLSFKSSRGGQTKTFLDKTNREFVASRPAFQKMLNLQKEWKIIQARNSAIY